MRTPLSRRVPALVLSLLAAAPAVVFAQEQIPPGQEVPPAPVVLPKFTPEGRAVTSQPLAGGIQVGSPQVDMASGFTFEKHRIKRTVPMDPSQLDGRWDLLYLAADTTGSRVTYFDWDFDYLYFAWESATPESVRFDIDGKGDGWLRGADNLSIQLSVPQLAGDDATTVTPQVFLQYLDAEQSRDHPVVATSAPVPLAEIKTIAGRTPRGTFVTMLAVPRSEAIGLERKNGSTFGLRVEPGLPPAPFEGTTTISTRPMVQLTLADGIEAQEKGLKVSLKTLGRREVTFGDNVQCVLEVENKGPEPVTFTRLFLRGSQNAVSLVDAASFTGQTLEPGKKIKRELKTSISPETPLGTLVLTGGVEWPDGGAVAALTSVDRVDPYSLHLDLLDPKPIAVGSSGVEGGSRQMRVTARSRMSGEAKGDIALSLPAGWSLDGSPAVRSVHFRGAWEVKPYTFTVLVPGSTPPGEYLVEATVTLAGKTYTTRSTVRVVPAEPAATTSSSR